MLIHSISATLLLLLLLVLFTFDAREKEQEVGCFVFVRVFEKEFDNITRMRTRQCLVFVVSLV